MPNPVVIAKGVDMLLKDKNKDANGNDSGLKNLFSSLSPLKSGNKLGQLGQLGFAAGQSIMGAINEKRANAMTPSSESPMERQMLNTIRRRRRAIETGTANAAQNASVRQMGKSLMTNSMRAGGQPNFGQYNQLIGNAMGNIAAQSGGQIANLLGQGQQQATGMVNRATDLNLLRRNEKKAESARLRQAGSQNLLAALGAGKLDKENQSLRQQATDSSSQINALMSIIENLKSQLNQQDQTN